MYDQHADDKASYIRQLSSRLQCDPTAGEQRISPVQDVLERISSEQRRSDATVQRLADRLGLVLSGPAPRADETNTAEEPHASNLHGDLLGKLYAQAALNRALDDLIDRLTV